MITVVLVGLLWSSSPKPIGFSYYDWVIVSTHTNRDDCDKEKERLTKNNAYRDMHCMNVSKRNNSER